MRFLRVKNSRMTSRLLLCKRRVSFNKQDSDMQIPDTDTPLILLALAVAMRHVPEPERLEMEELERRIQALRGTDFQQINKDNTMSIHIDDLRDIANNKGIGVCDLAADEIEALEAEVQRLDNWHIAVLVECATIAACYQESDPAKSVANLIDWHRKDAVWHHEQEAAGRAAEPAPGFGWKAIKLSEAPKDAPEIYPDEKTYQFIAPRGDGSVAGNEAWLFTVPPPPSDSAEPAPPAEMADPLDMPLPCDIVLGNLTLRKGVGLSSLVLTAKRYYEMAHGHSADDFANRTSEQRLADREAAQKNFAAIMENIAHPAPQAPALTDSERLDAKRWQLLLEGSLYHLHRELYSAICEGFTAAEINAAADAAMATKDAS